MQYTERSAIVVSPLSSSKRCRASVPKFLISVMVYTTVGSSLTSWYEFSTRFDCKKKLLKMCVRSATAEDTFWRRYLFQQMQIFIWDSDGSLRIEVILNVHVKFRLRGLHSQQRQQSSLCAVAAAVCDTQKRRAVSGNRSSASLNFNINSTWLLVSGEEKETTTCRGRSRVSSIFSSEAKHTFAHGGQDRNVNEALKPPQFKRNLFISERDGNVRPCLLLQGWGDQRCEREKRATSQEMH
ncbi:hypothetical protein INR49_030401 [Caranx melampygus]|nr:hypothetical protein INR49_030401 [Caranx melampygus]